MALYEITGRAIGQGLRQNISRLTTITLGTEILYAFVIILCSLMIYFGTKKLYELSSHKGIKYFRLTFLFFALAYFFRSFIKIILIDSTLGISNQLSQIIFGPLIFMIFMYFSAMSIFYLLYSVMWKKWDKNPNRIYLFHLLAAAIAITCTLFHNSLIHFLINIILFIFIIFVVTIAKKHSKKKKGFNTFYIYVLLLAFWIINLLDLLIPSVFYGLQIFIYLASMSIFLAILYKVLKNIGVN